MLTLQNLIQAIEKAKRKACLELSDARSDWKSFVNVIDADVLLAELRKMEEKETVEPDFEMIEEILEQIRTSPNGFTNVPQKFLDRKVELGGNGIIDTPPITWKVIYSMGMKLRDQISALISRLRGKPKQKEAEATNTRSTATPSSTTPVRKTPTSTREVKENPDGGRFNIRFVTPAEDPNHPKNVMPNTPGGAPKMKGPPGQPPK